MQNFNEIISPERFPEILKIAEVKDTLKAFDDFKNQRKSA